MPVFFTKTYYRALHMDALLSSIASVAGLPVTSVTLDVSDNFNSLVERSGKTMDELTLLFVGGLSDNLTTMSKNPIALAAFQASWTSGVIRLCFSQTPDGSATLDHQTTIDDGTLGNVITMMNHLQFLIIVAVVTVFDVRNPSKTGVDLLSRLGDSGGLSVVDQTNVNEFDSAKIRHLEAIKAAVGLSGDVRLGEQLRLCRVFALLY
jgi:hypothetical protein